MLEIGAGTGALTSRLAPLVASLTAVELDSSLIPYLQEIAKIEVINADILDLDLRSFAGDQKIRVIGNLPYYISSPILMHLIRNRSVVWDMTLMFQEEVAARITAPVSTSEYGLLAVASQYFCSIEKGFRISKNSFSPKPEIESRILKLTPLQETAIDTGEYIQFLQKAFSQRRKKLRNNLIRTLEVPAARLDEIFLNLGISENARAENISPQLFEELIRAFAPGN